MEAHNGHLIPKSFGPLQGVRILSTGTLIAQPFAAHLAAAFGAQVIQIEHPSGTTDPWRRLDDKTRGAGAVDVATCFVQERRNAFYVTLDLCRRRSARPRSGRNWVARPCAAASPLQHFCRHALLIKGPSGGVRPVRTVGAR
jgi:hypothetical protein